MLNNVSTLIQALSRHSNNIATYRWPGLLLQMAFCQPCQAMISYKRAWGHYKGCTGCQSPPNIHSGLCYGLGQLRLFLSTSGEILVLLYYQASENFCSQCIVCIINSYINSSPVADASLLNTLIMMSVVDGLLRITISRTGPLSSSIPYVDWPKLTLGANQNNKTTYVQCVYEQFLAVHLHLLLS